MLLQWWMLILNVAKVSNNEVGECMSNTCDPKAQDSDSFFQLYTLYDVSENGYALYGHLCGRASKKKVDLKGGEGSLNSFFQTEDELTGCTKAQYKIKKGYF